MIIARESAILKFSTYIQLVEAKVDDLADKHPEHADAIHVYNKVDPTPTKKFLPWLVKQHIAGNLTPDDARLHPTLSNFDKFSHKLQSKDHNNYNYNELADAVGVHIQNKIQLESKKNAVDKIYTDGEITAHHIKTREAAQQLYGGGKARCGEDGGARGTSWCVAARGDKNLFGTYGPAMYTIHVRGDKNAPYAVHPFTSGGPLITDRHNKSDRNFSDALKIYPHIRQAYHAIESHSSKNLSDHIHNSEPKKMGVFIHHPLINSEHLKYIQENGDAALRSKIAMRQNLPDELIHNACRDKDELVQKSVLNRSDLNDDHLKSLLGSQHLNVVSDALAHPNMSPTLRKVAGTYISDTYNKLFDFGTTQQDLHQYIKSVADGKIPSKNLNFIVANPAFNSTHIDKILDIQSKRKTDVDQDLYDVKTRLVKLPMATKGNLSKAIANDFKHDASLTYTALKHPNADASHISQTFEHSPYHVAIHNFKHPLHNAEHVEQGLKYPDYTVRQAALESPHATVDQHLHSFANDPHWHVRVRSFNYLTKNDPANIPKYVRSALQSDLPSLRKHVLNGPHATLEDHKHTFENDSWYLNRQESFAHLVKKDPLNMDKYLDRALKDDEISEFAVKFPGLSGEKLKDIISNRRDVIATRALLNPNVEEEHLLAAVKRPRTEGAVSSSRFLPARKAIQHKKATRAVLEAGLSHSDTQVQKAAQKKLTKLSM